MNQIDREDRDKRSLRIALEMYERRLQEGVSAADDIGICEVISKIEDHLAGETLLDQSEIDLIIEPYEEAINKRLDDEDKAEKAYEEDRVPWTEKGPYCECGGQLKCQVSCIQTHDCIIEGNKVRLLEADASEVECIVEQVFCSKCGKVVDLDTDNLELDEVIEASGLFE